MPFSKIIYFSLMAASLLMLLLNKQRLDRRLLLFIPLLILALSTEGIRVILGKNHPLSNFFFSVYSPLEYLLLGIFIASYLKNSSVKKIIYISIPVFVLISAIDQIWLKPLGLFYTYLDAFIENPLICLWTLCYFFQFSNEKEAMNFMTSPVFWLSIGNLLFYSVSTFSYGFGGYLLHIGHKDDGFLVFWIGRIFNFVLYFFYTIAFSTPFWIKKS